MQTKAILFDLDGVILDSEKEYRRFWMQAAEELGFPLKEDVTFFHDLAFAAQKAMQADAEKAMNVFMSP